MGFGVRALAVVFAAGCSFTPPSSATGGAGEVDASPTSDSQVAPIDAAPVWTVIETLQVDTASAVPMTSTTALDAGVVYHLRVSGTITNVIDSFQGDADYYDFGSPKDLGCCEDIGLGIDDLVVNDKVTQPDWGPYDPSHVYEVEWTGSGQPITALFQDTFYGNNIGTLTLEILALR